ncbi:MAG: DUF1801 domain-containing protein [Bacteroidia bacterium]|nr:DUF1801 domain-containing protein [Bacteroidia bacterium]
MNQEIKSYNERQIGEDKLICYRLGLILSKLLSDAENKIWHKHPVWFLDENPIVGYSKLKTGIRLMFWSGASFEEDKLKIGTGKFKDASILYSSIEQIEDNEIIKWVEKGREIQWDYKNIYKRKGKLVRLK